MAHGLFNFGAVNVAADVWRSCLGRRHLGTATRRAPAAAGPERRTFVTALSAGHTERPAPTAEWRIAPLTPRPSNAVFNALGP
jgi:hypothetical protein